MSNNGKTVILNDDALDMQTSAC